jgi:hypothetical protein
VPKPPNVGDEQLGKTRVLSRRCATCILNPASTRIPLVPGRLRQFISDTIAAGSYVVCHSTLPGAGNPDVHPAVCRGFADTYDTPALRLIRALWGFVEVDPPAGQR